MEKKIRKQLILVGIGSMLLSVLLCALTFYNVLEKQVQRELQAACAMIETTYYATENVLYLEGYSSNNLRITLIQASGEVLFDNEGKTGEMPNHLDRPEVQLALTEGYGGAKRISDTLNEETYYYAVKLTDGDILRVSVDAQSRFGMLGSAVPIILAGCGCVLLLSILLSFMMTKVLVRPIVKMSHNLEEIDREIPYPELQPFVAAIVRDRNIRKENETIRQEFTANVSHELKTPLTSISGYAELIETGMAKPEDVQNFAQRIHKEAGRLLNLVNDIIELSRLDAAQERKQAQVEFEMLDLKDIVIACVDHLGVNAQKAYVTLLFEGEHVLLQGNRSMIEELCTNLCDNAIRYNKPGGKVVVSCGGIDGIAYLRVRDTGIGISEEQQERVFERFYRADKSRSKETGGTGLGLAIVKHIAMLHEAQIELHSEIGVGTDIRILFNGNKK